MNYSDYSDTINTFIERLPTHPMCTDNLGDGIAHKPRGTALKRDYLQFNPKHYQQALIFDIDREAACFAAEDNNVLQPSFITQSKKRNGYAHFVYLLKNPIATHDFANFHPIRYAAAIQNGYTRRLEADRGYAGFITKNPVTHDTIDFNRMFNLEDLDAWLDFTDKAPDYTKRESQGLGRNVDMFDTVRFEAYAEVASFTVYESFYEWVIKRCNQVNDAFPCPLPQSEPRATSKSIAAWTWKNRHNFGGNYKNRGVMMLDMVEDMTAQERQRAGAEHSARVKAASTLAKIQSSYVLALQLGKKPTQKVIASNTGLSLRTVKGYWSQIQK